MQYLIFFFFLLFLNGWVNGSRKRLQIVTKFQRIFNPVSGDNTSRYLFHKILPPFPAFTGGVENTVSFSKTVNQFENCLQIMIKVHKFYKKCAAWTEVCCTTWSPFSRWKCATWKNRGKNFEYLRHSSTDFHQDSPRWSHHVWPSKSYNRWPGKCRSRQTFSEMLIFDKYF